MQIYNIEKENNYIARSLSEIELFETYSLYQLIRYFDFHEERLVGYKFSGDKNKTDITLSSGIIQEHHTKPYQIPDKILNFSIKTENFVKFSRITGNFVYPPGQDLKKVPKTIVQNFKVYREDMIRRLSYPSYFFYFKIPWQFLNAYLKTIICKTRLSTFYKAFKGKDLTDYLTYIETYREYDMKNPARFEDPNLKKSLTGVSTSKKAPRYKWRADMFPDMLYTLARFGYAYPSIQTGDKILFDGSHRLSCAPVVKKDYPVLLELAPHNYTPGTPYWVVSPAWFTGGAHIALEIDPPRNWIGGMFIQKADADKYLAYKDTTEFPKGTIFSYKNKPNLIKYLNKLISSRDYDFKFQLPDTE